MNLWKTWYQCVHYFQPACSRSRTFFYLVLVLVGFSIRPECAGVTSFIRASFLEPSLYKGFLHFFNYSTGLDLAYLTSCWCEMAHRIFPVHRVSGYFVYVADGLKVSKEGKKMPGVKKLHQSSENNSKAPYIMGHSFQALALLVRSAKGHVMAVPLISRIHNQSEKFTTALSPVYGERKKRIHYRTEVLLWRPVGVLVRFVWVIHPSRGKIF